MRSRRRLHALTPAILLVAALASAPRARAEELVRHVGRVTIRLDGSRGFPGGVLVVRLVSGVRLGGAWAILDGRRAPFHVDRSGLRALVPVAAEEEAGQGTLGIGIAARRGEQRIAVPVEITAHPYPTRTVALPVPFQTLVALPDAARDARQLLAAIRTESPSPVPESLRPPVAVAGSGFGELRTYPGFSELESRIDALTGERHRGIDYAVPAGTPVAAPGAGSVLFAGPLVLSGQTLVIDHGQGVVSVLLHLSRTDVVAGAIVAAGSPVGLSGESGLTPLPALEWRVYLHGVAVDPLVLASALRP